MKKWELIGIEGDEWMELFRNAVSCYDQHLYMGTGEDYFIYEEDMEVHEEWVHWKMYLHYHEDAWNRWYKVDDLRY